MLEQMETFEEGAPWGIYEDKDIIVCHKPAGIAVQSARIGQKDMESVLNNYMAGKNGRIYVVHRLDQPVEGVIVFAKHKKAAAELTRQISQGTMKKIYQAVCCYEGEVPFAVREFMEKESADTARETASDDRWICLEDYLIKDGRTNTSRVGKKGQKDAKKAVLEYQVIKHDPEQKKVMVRIHLHTGRHHQIRVQMANAGLPLYGDAKYNPFWNRLTEGEETQNTKTMVVLCAVETEFFHPGTRKKVKYMIESKHPTLNKNC